MKMTEFVLYRLWSDFSGLLYSLAAIAERLPRRGAEEVSP